MTQNPLDSSRTWSAWSLLTRTVRPTYGARRNAADALQEAQDTRRERTEAADLLRRSATPPGAAAAVPRSRARGPR